MQESTSKTAFDRCLETAATLLLDGGLATELEAQGYEIGTELWSAGLLLDNPQAIVDAHRAYLDAGAQVIISASYQASRAGFMQLGRSAGDADRAIMSSVEIACQARDEFMTSQPTGAFRPLVAASIGPYGATLHDGSEYTGQYDISREALLHFHRERLAVLDASEADLLACETIPSLLEAEVLAELLAGQQTPSWVSFSCRDQAHIADGSPIALAAALFDHHPRVRALGVNCTAPQFIPALIGLLRAAAPAKAIVVYPNSGEQYRVRDNSWHGTASPLECADAAAAWVRSGARLVGGCCRMGPAHIKAMHKALPR